jgi:hypothetical protein
MFGMIVFPMQIRSSEQQKKQPVACNRITSSHSSSKPSISLAARPASARRAAIEVTHVPAPIRNRDRLIGTGEPVLPRYERIAFEKSLIAPHGEPLAAFVCPGHLLLDATLDLTLDRHRDLLRRGTVLVDESDPGTMPVALLLGARRAGCEPAQKWRSPDDFEADALRGDGCHRPSPPYSLRSPISTIAPSWLMNLAWMRCWPGRKAPG